MSAQPEEPFDRPNDVPHPTLTGLLNHWWSQLPKVHPDALRWFCTFVIGMLNLWSIYLSHQRLTEATELAGRYLEAYRISGDARAERLRSLIKEDGVASPEAVHPSSPPAPLWVHSLFLDGGTTVTLDTRPPTGTPWATSRYTWHCGYGPMVYGEEVGLEWRETHVDADGNRTYWHGGTDGSGPPQEDACASDSKPSAFNCLVDRTSPTVRIMGCPADGGTY